MILSEIRFLTGNYALSCDCACLENGFARWAFGFSGQCLGSVRRVLVSRVGDLLEMAPASRIFFFSLVFGLLLFSGPMRAFSESEISDKNKTLIVLDPGHGGLDSGTSTSGGLKEKIVVLDVAKRLKRVLTEKYHHPVRLTRNSDVQRALPERTTFANGKQATLFVSLHVNSSGTGTVRGFEAYYLDASGDRAAMRLAEAENRANGHGGDGTSIDDIQFILSDLIQSSKMHDSILLAHAIEEQVLLGLKDRWSGVRSLGVKKAPFYVLVGARMPCVLLEMFFADNKEDARLLGKESFRDDLARAIGKGIDKFLGD